jgi:polyisoprenoid-binding protein YceI
MLKRRNIFIVVIVILLVAVPAAIYIYDDLFGLGGPRSADPVAPELVAAEAQDVVYRIDPTQSEVRYYVDEIFAGEEVSTAVGTTKSIAGDVLINEMDIDRIEVGTIVINIEHFESDSGLRDGRIRQEYLESSSYPEAVFVPTEMINFPSDPTTGTDYTFQMVGDLTVKETTAEATWDVTASLEGDTLSGQATTTVLMSTYDVGPIEIAGFVETSDEVRLEFDFIALAVSSEDVVAVSDEADVENTSADVLPSDTNVAVEPSDLARMTANAQAISTEAMPAVRLDVMPDPVAGYNLRVETLNFVLSAEQSGQANMLGEGHAYLFVNGQQHTRIYSEWLHIDQLPNGEHQLTVVLANNDGTLLSNGQEVILAGTTVVVE